MISRQDRDTSVIEDRIGSDYVHISSLIDICARQYYIADSYPQLLAKRTTGGHQVMWKMGLAAEEHARSQIIKDCDRAGIWGRWECRCGHASHSGFYSAKYLSCTICNGPVEHYKQQPLYDHDAKIVGTGDIPFLVDDRMLVGEVKSMNAPQYDDLTGPLADHIFQAHGYRRLFIKNGFSVMDDVAILYITKGFVYGDPYKEFHVPVSPLIDTILDAAWADALVLKQARYAKQIPERLRVCVAASSSRVKNCPVGNDCMARSR